MPCGPGTSTVLRDTGPRPTLASQRFKRKYPRGAGEKGLGAMKASRLLDLLREHADVGGELRCVQWVSVMRALGVRSPCNARRLFALCNPGLVRRVGVRTV